MAPEIVERATHLSVSKNFNKKLMARPLSFNVGEYTVYIKLHGVPDNPDITLSCDCKFFQYSGPKYHASKNGYLFNGSKEVISEPKQRDPNGINKVCKHIVAVMRDYF